MKFKIEKNEADIPNAAVVEQSMPAILVDRKEREGRVRTSDGQSTLRTGPEEKSKTQRALVVPENGEELVLLGAPLVRFTRSTA